MLKKLSLTALTAVGLAIGAAAMATPADAQVFFGLGVGNGPYYGDGYYRHGYYGDGYPYGYRRFHHHRNCFWTNVRRHHHWVRVRRCDPFGY